MANVRPLIHTMANWRDKTDPATLVALWERAKTTGDPSGFASGGFMRSEFELVLNGFLELNPQIPELERRKIVSAAIRAVESSRPMRPASLLSACSRLEKDYLTLPKKPFRLLTEVSVASHLQVPLVRLGATTLSFNPKSVPGFTERAALFRDSRHSIGFELPTNYMRLAAMVSARTPFEAAERALNDIDLVRASWNLALNRGKAWRYSSGRPPPVNDIRLSPFHTLHETSGTPATESWWYDPNYSRPANLFSDKARFPGLLKFSKSLRERLSVSAYRPELEAALVRYVRALDSSDLNDAFLRLWSLLEFLTDSGHDPYKVATRRAAYMFADRERSIVVLTHLTNHRNRFVHAGSDTDDIESLVFLLKRYVDVLLLFHIGNRYGFKSRTEAAHFMDLPYKRAALDERLALLRYAKRFTSGTAEA